MFHGPDAERPRYPNLFCRTPGSLVGHGEALVRPPESEQLDYEGEIAMVIGRRGRRIPRAHALDHVAGLTCVNEGTIRDWLRHGSINVTQGKNFERSGAIGPWITTLDEIGDVTDLPMRTFVNGEPRQSGTTATLFFDFAMLIEYLSTFMELKPGDIISTGSPPGAGVRQDPPRFLVPGDEVVVEVEGVGRLANRVVDEA
jgi:5-carboxymethyl-2-hydroxymuconate isomerase